MFKLLMPSQICSPLDTQDVHSTLDDDDLSGSHVGYKREILPGPLRIAFQKVLGPNALIPAYAMFSNSTMVNNRSFTALNRHKGNSGVLRINSNIPFCIDQVVEFQESAIAQCNSLQGKWLVGRSIKRIQVQHDPYSDFPCLRASLWGTDLESSLEVCCLDDIESHFAQHCISWEGEDATVIVSLSWVSVELPHLPVVNTYL